MNSDKKWGLKARQDNANELWTELYRAGLKTTARETGSPPDYGDKQLYHGDMAGWDGEDYCWMWTGNRWAHISELDKQ